MTDHYNKIGIKQVIRLEWMDRILDMLLAEMKKQDIRNELKSYLADKKQSGGIGERGDKSYVMAIGILIKTWGEPLKEIIPLRDKALFLAKKMDKKDRIALHWAMISAAYPFWSNVAKQTGRLFNLQEHVTQKQIVSRLKEQYGDRQTISRYARYVLRSFISWGVIKDSKNRGFYEIGINKEILDLQEALILLEAGLLTLPEKKCDYNSLIKSPIFFPFQIPKIPSEQISNNSSHLETIRYDMDNELLKLKKIY